MELWAKEMLALRKEVIYFFIYVLLATTDSLVIIFAKEAIIKSNSKFN